jgi:isoquinoline 1-oxidoreductase beta subunit
VEPELRGLNFLGGAEQSFLDEFAGKDRIDFRLEFFEKAKNKPVRKDNDYDADRQWY